MLLAGNLPWAFLVTWNRRAGVFVPWALVPMAIYLWAYFSYIGGRWGEPGSAQRRENLRANQVPGAVWRVAVPAGLLGFGAILALLAVVARVVELPAGAPLTTPAGMPMATMFALSLCSLAGGSRAGRSGNSVRRPHRWFGVAASMHGSSRPCSLRSCSLE